MIPDRTRRSALVAVAVVGVLAAACSSASSSPGTTSGSTSATSSSTSTLAPAVRAVLEPKLLTLADFPKGWKQDTEPNAAETGDTPPCLADVVLAKGSTHRASAVFVGPTSDQAVVIHTVAVFPPGGAEASATSLRSGFLACNGSSTTLANGVKVHLATSLLPGQPAGSGFAGRMTVTSGSQQDDLYAVVSVVGDITTSLVWSAGTDQPDTTVLALAAAARQRA